MFVFCENCSLSLDIGLCLFRIGDCLAAEKNGLGHLKQGGLAVQRPERRCLDDVRCRHRVIGVDVLVVIERQGHPRSPVRHRLRQRFVGLPQQRPAGQKVGIGVVGRRQGLDQALRAGLLWQTQSDRKREPCDCAGVTQTGRDTHGTDSHMGAEPSTAGTGIGSPRCSGQTGRRIIKK